MRSDETEADKVTWMDLDTIVEIHARLTNTMPTIDYTLGRIASGEGPAQKIESTDGHEYKDYAESLLKRMAFAFGGDEAGMKIVLQFDLGDEQEDTEDIVNFFNQCAQDFTMMMKAQAERAASDGPKLFGLDGHPLN